MFATREQPGGLIRPRSSSSRRVLPVGLRARAVAGTGTARHSHQVRAALLGVAAGPAAAGLAEADRRCRHYRRAVRPKPVANQHTHHHTHALQAYTWYTMKCTLGIQLAYVHMGYKISAHIRSCAHPDCVHGSCRVPIASAVGVAGQWLPGAGTRARARSQRSKRSSPCCATSSR